MCFSRRELIAAQSENFQLEKKLHELQMSIQNPSMPGRYSDIGNGLPLNSSAPATPSVVRKYHEMKYGQKSSSSNLVGTTNYSHTSSFDAGQTMNLLPGAARNGNLLPGKNAGPPSPATSNNAAGGSPRQSTFKFTSKLPDSIQNTIATTSQTIQSKLPASLQKLPQSLSQAPTINMLASKFQNAFS